MRAGKAPRREGARGIRQAWIAGFRRLGSSGGANADRTIDLDRYLDRIGLSSGLRPGLDSLEALHVAHLARIPFENVDVRLGRPINLDLDSLQAKIVRGRRGGYCFEHNTLFAAALRTLGFHVTTLEARVRYPGAAEVLPRTHMVLEVRLGDRAYLADVGYGGAGPFLPLPIDGTLSPQPEGRYRVGQEKSGQLVLRREWRGEWRDLYVFSRTPVLPVDYEVANYYTSTHPSSDFLRTLTVQICQPGGRRILRGRTYTLRRGEEETVRRIKSAELPSLLRGQFGLNISDEEAFLALGDD